ncbi:cobalt transporter CbiM [Motiliproteus sp. SC1-56]|uniref:cobalt transporter CbiM n=1 Tax=Motiliproteus sp. SC1-56 TaxID=2799565 RepID=UPI001A8CD334
MAHIPDGVLSAPVLTTGAVLSAGALVYALRRLDYDRIPQAAMLSALFFVASLVNVPVGASSVHLILNGLMGILLGWAAVPALLVALLLQAIFFGYGGLAVLGINTLNLALPALLCAALFRGAIHRCHSPRQLFWLGALTGFSGIALTGVLVCLALALSGPEYIPAAKVALLTYVPLMLAEAAITGTILGFVQRVAPEQLRLQQVTRD